MRSEDPTYRYVSPMRDAFAAARVDRPDQVPLAKRIVRVMKRHQRKPS